MSTLKVDTILKRTGTGTIVLGQSGDTISIPSGATLNSAGTNTLEGISNTPAFGVTVSPAGTCNGGSKLMLVFLPKIISSDADNATPSDITASVPLIIAVMYTLRPVPGLIADPAV